MKIFTFSTYVFIGIIAFITSHHCMGQENSPNDKAKFSNRDKVIRPNSVRPEPRGLEIAAVAMRLGDYKYAIDIYREILPDTELDDTRTNRLDLQIMLNLATCYEKMEGDPLSRISRAYMWLTLAESLAEGSVSSHDKDKLIGISSRKKSLGYNLTASQISDSVKMAQKCWRSLYRQCSFDMPPS